MAVAEFGMTVFLQPAIILFVNVSIIALLLSRESYTSLFLLTITEVSCGQSQKAYLGIIVTLSPMVKDVRLVQALNTGLS